MTGEVAPQPLVCGHEPRVNNEELYIGKQQDKRPEEGMTVKSPKIKERVPSASQCS